MELLERLKHRFGIVEHNPLSSDAPAPGPIGPASALAIKITAQILARLSVGHVQPSARYLAAHLEHIAKTYGRFRP